MYRTRNGYSWIRVSAEIILFFLIAGQQDVWEQILRFMFPLENTWIHQRATLFELLMEHLFLAGISSVMAVIAGVALGIAATRSVGRMWMGIISAMIAWGQTMPPVAVIALAVPFCGFGAKPTIVALFIFSILPVLRGTITGIDMVQEELIEVAHGMGMKPYQTFWRVEWPLALPVIIGGIRTAVVINIATATIGAAIGAGGLGVPIISGLVMQNPAFVLEGAIPAACLALLIDALLKNIESSINWQ
ncbi:MAG: ABC transporter permease [Bacillota bacterium]|nr:ABC transporter permease [Bacillota bacterium]